MENEKYDIFVSYNRQDDVSDSQSQGWISNFVEMLKGSFINETGNELKIFMDNHEIEDNQIWEDRLLHGIKSSKLFLVFLSRNYIESANCKWEWKEYRKREHSLAGGSDGMIFVCLQAVPGLHGISNDTEYLEFNRRLLESKLLADWLSVVKTDLDSRQVYLDSSPNLKGNKALFDFRSLFSEKYPDLSTHFEPGSTNKKTLYADKIKSIAGQIRLRLIRCSLSQMTFGNVSRPPTRFIGRVSELSELRQLLIYDKSSSIVVINGQGGIGKTSLSFQFASSFQEHFAAGGVWVLNCQNVQSISSAIAQLAEEPIFKENIQKLPQNEMVANRVVFDQLQKIFIRRNEELANKLRIKFGPKTLDLINWQQKCLLILDNVDNVDLLSSAQLSLLPNFEWLEVIITTRIPASLVGAKIGNKHLKCLPLDGLTDDDSVSLVQEFYPDGKFPNHLYESQTRNLVERFNGYTLAIELVGSFLGSNPGIMPDEYLTKLEKRGLPEIDQLVHQSSASAISYYGAEDRKARQISSILLETIGQLEESCLDIAAKGAIRTMMTYASLMAPRIFMPWLESLIRSRHTEMGIQSIGEINQWLYLYKVFAGSKLIFSSDKKSSEITLENLTEVPVICHMHNLVAMTWINSCGKEDHHVAKAEVIEEIWNFAEPFAQVWQLDQRLFDRVKPLQDVSVYLSHLAPTDFRVIECVGISARIEAIVGSLSHSLDLWSLAIRLGEDLVNSNLVSSKARISLAKHLSYLYICLLDRNVEGDYVVARLRMKQCFELLQSVIEKEDTNYEAISELAIAIEMYHSTIICFDEHVFDEKEFHEQLGFATEFLERAMKDKDCGNKIKQAYIKVLECLGTHYLDHKDYPKAQSYILRARGRLDSLMTEKKSPMENVHLQIRLTNKLGEVYLRRWGHLDTLEARDAFNKSVNLARGLAEQGWDSSYGISELAESLIKLAEVEIKAKNNGWKDKANAILDEVKSMIKDHEQKYTHWGQLNSHFSKAVSLGMHINSDSDFSEVKEDLLASKKGIMEFIDYDSWIWLTSAKEILNQVGSAFVSGNESTDWPKVHEAMKELDKVNKKIFEKQPGNRNALREHISGLNRLADSYLATGNRDAALENFDKALKLSNSLMEDNPDREDKQVHASCQLGLGMYFLGFENEPKIAFDWLIKCCMLMRPLFLEDKSNPDNLKLYSLGNYYLAQTIVFLDDDFLNGSQEDWGFKALDAAFSTLKIWKESDNPIPKEIYRIFEDLNKIMG